MSKAQNLLFFVRGILCLTAFLGALTFLSASSVDAALVITVYEVGSDVVITGSGSIDTTDLIASPSISAGPNAIYPGIGVLAIGEIADPLPRRRNYSGITGPASFGGGSSFVPPDLGSGDSILFTGVGNDRSISLPLGYLSGGALLSSSTYFGHSIDTLELARGTYEWNWGTGANADSIHLVVGVPEPTSSLAFWIGIAGLALARGRKQQRLVSDTP